MGGGGGGGVGGGLQHELLHCDALRVAASLFSTSRLTFVHGEGGEGTRVEELRRWRDRDGGESKRQSRLSTLFLLDFLVKESRRKAANWEFHPLPGLLEDAEASSDTIPLSLLCGGGTGWGGAGSGAG